MIFQFDYKALQTLLNTNNPITPVAEEEATETHRSLGEFLVILSKINAREHVVLTRELNGK